MTNRIPKVNELIKREISRMILREIEFPVGVLVTVTRVETSSDVKEASIYISVLPDNKEKKVHEVLKKQMYFIQQKFNNNVKMRPLPRLKFLEEKEIIQADRVEGLLEQLKND
jgi:ribosome-binding factor A